MKSIRNLILQVTLLISFPSLADIHFLPRLELGQSAYDLRLTGNIQLPLGQVLSPRGSLSAQVYVLRVGGALSYKSAFADLSFQTSTTDSTTQVIPELSLTEQWSAERNDVNLTIGYALTESVSVFIGYRDLEAKGEGVLNSRYRFKDNGGFVGSSYSYDVTETATLSVSAAYAFLDVEFDQVLAGFPLPLDSGDGDGLKLGLQWSDSLNDSMGYVLSADWYDYQYDLSNAASDIEISLEEVNVRLGIVVVF